MKRFLTFAVTVAVSLTLLAQTDLQKDTPFSGMHRISTFGMRQKVAGPLATRPTTSLISRASLNPAFNSQAPVRRRLTAGGNTFFGYLGESSDENAQHGLYEMTSTPVNQLKWADPVYDGGYGPGMQSGWLYSGKVCGFSPVLFYGYIVGLDYVEFDLASGETVTDESMSLDDLYLMMTGCYNEADGYVYGYGTHGTGTDAEYCLMRAPVTDPKSLSVVYSYGGNPMGTCLSMTYNPDDRSIYGVRTDGYLVKIASDGKQTEIYKAAPDDMGIYYTGLVYIVREGVFYWQICRDDYTSSLYTFNASTKSSTLVCNYTNSEEYMYFITESAASDPKAPKRPTYKNTTISNGATSGNVVYTLPTELVDGTSISSTVDWEMLLDGATYSTGKGVKGSDVTVTFTGLATGMHSFALCASVNNVQGGSEVKQLYIGYDTPRSPANVSVDTKGLVTWNAVTAGINDGYLDKSDLTYIVSVNGSEQGRTSSTSYQLDIDPSAPLSPLTVQVTAVCRSLESKPATSNTVIIGAPLTLDVSLAPTEEESLLFTIIDGNRDGITWSYVADGFGIPCFYSGYSDTDLDEWLILPAITLNDPSVFYNFSMMVRGRSANFPEEYFEVKFGTAPKADAMTGTIIPKTKITAFDSFELTEALFKIPSSGTYYIAVHGISSPEQYSLMVGDFKVSLTKVTDSSPAAVTDLVGTGSIDGTLSATVSFVMPTVDMNGKALSENTDISATVTADEVKSVTGKPGSKHSVTIRTRQGINRITVSTSVGSTAGAEASVEVYTGVDVPLPVENLTATILPDMMSALFSWTVSATGEQGGYVNPDDCTFNIHLYDAETEKWNVLATGITGNQWTLTLPAGSPQLYRRLGVEIINPAGAAEKIRTVYFVLGTPYTLPMKETFDGATNDYEPFVTYSLGADYTCTWQYEASNSILGGNATGNMIVATASVAGAKGRLGFPAFSTKGVPDVRLTMMIWNGATAPSQMDLYYMTAMMSEPVLLARLPKAEGWTNVGFNLPEDLLGLDWLRLYIDCTMSNTSQIFVLDEFSIVSPTAVEKIESPVSHVMAGDGYIDVVASDESTIKVYSVDGRMLDSGKGCCRLYVAPGVYLVDTGCSVEKIAVR